MSPYLAGMTSRLLLTLLAFLTGFAVHNAPAEARVLGQSSAEVGAVAGNAAAIGASIAATGAKVAARRDGAAQGAPGPVPAPAALRHQPAVRVGIDRARE